MAPPRQKRLARRPRAEPEEQEALEEGADDKTAEPVEDEPVDEPNEDEPNEDEMVEAEGEPEAEGPLERYAPFLWRVAPPAVVLGALAAGWVFGAGTTILVLAGGVLVLVITFFWSSIRALVGETKLTGADAFVLAVPTAEEEKKRALLRALKDIEYEHSVGKLSDADYHELATRYRGEAKALLVAIDEKAKPRRARADAYVRTRRGEAVPEPASPDPGAAPASPGPAPGGASPAAGPGPTAELLTCPECDAPNAVGSESCKSCGTSLRAEKVAEPSDAREDA